MNIDELINHLGGLNDLHASGTISKKVLKAIDRICGRDIAHSMETGCGLSSILFSNISHDHKVFAIDLGESITNVRNNQYFNSKSVEIIEAPTQVSIPKYEFKHRLDVALIDGPHAYPFPELEYYFIYPHLNENGILIVDDIHIPTIQNFYRFLREEQMFDFVEVVGNTAFFRRNSTELFNPYGDGWWLQKYNLKNNQLNSLFRHVKELFENRKSGVFVEPMPTYYSPIVLIDEIKRDEHRIFEREPNLSGFNLCENDQKDLLNKLKEYYSEMPYSDENAKGVRYSFSNKMFCYADAIILYSLLRHFHPKKVIEVGSGHSSAITLDTNEMFLKDSVKCLFIEPFPDRLLSLLKPGDQERFQLIPKRIQDVDLEHFRALEKNDFLFIDSTHVSKTGSDVNYILFEILPILKKGVIIHFHDIFYPFEYPREWVLDMGRSWNEIYILRAFLSHNEGYKILLFNSFLGQKHKDWFERNMPLFLQNIGGSLWVQKQ